ncbi:hypothetical protein SSS_01383 [Sarcoptes scabiei]|nr:hypothetical protein SSS_01383 [Sarcoptes scabiei]
MPKDNPYNTILQTIEIDQKQYKFYDPNQLNDVRYAKLPFSIRVLLESAIRSCDGFHVKQQDIEKILDWNSQQYEKVEVPFRPSRVLLQDLTGVAAVVDFAAMREAFHKLNGDPNVINPLCPADLVIDHSVQVDFARAYVFFFSLEKKPKTNICLKNNNRCVSIIQHQINLTWNQFD